MIVLAFHGGPTLPNTYSGFDSIRHRLQLNSPRNTARLPRTNCSASLELRRYSEQFSFMIYSQERLQLIADRIHDELVGNVPPRTIETSVMIYYIPEKQSYVKYYTARISTSDYTLFVIHCSAQVEGESCRRL